MKEVFATLESAPLLFREALLSGLKHLGLPDFFLALTSVLLGIGTIIGIFAGLFALISVVERKVLARIQNRYGPNRVGPFGILQPVADGIKMITKEDIVPAAADRVLHFWAPVLAVVPALVSFAVIPFGRDLVLVDIESGILLIFALGAIVEVAIFMAGWSSRSKFALLGSMRAIAQVISYELPLILAATAVVMMAGSLSPVSIVAAQSGILSHWFVFSPWGAAAFLLFITAALAESNRSPFDLPEGESEIVAGHMTEYSGFKYALFFMGEYFGLMVMAALGVTLFLGGWHAPHPALAFIPTWAWFFLKLAVLLFAALWVRGTLPRLRSDQLMNFCWKYLIPLGFVVVLTAACWHFTGGGLLGWGVCLSLLAIPYLIAAVAYNQRFRTMQRSFHFSD